MRSVSEDQRETLRARLRGVGYHSQKRSLVRDPKFRSLSPAIQEAYIGTKWETLRSVYDDVPVEDMREALEGLREAPTEPKTGDAPETIASTIASRAAQ